ncbi:MAG: helix-turn-helix transcriptional regulator [Oscillospiraceae bacterium]|nr:helix-turn-helix transcriptional regulator [Candidatus Equicaccousia limihippi]
MIGDNIRNYRKANNMSQDELAEKLDVTRQSISLWENGQTQPSLDNIVAMAKLFGVSTDDLLAENPAAANGGEAAVGGAVAPNAQRPKKPNNKTTVILCLIAVLLVALIVLGLFVLPNVLGIGSANTSSNISSSSSAAKTSSAQKTSSAKKTVKMTTSKTTKTTTTQKTQKDLYGTLKQFILKNGSTSGSSCIFCKTAPTYGGEAGDNFSVSYWGSDDEVTVCMTYNLDDTYCLNTYLTIPKSYSGKYQYLSSYNYKSNGNSVYEASGTITASEFTEKFPLPCSKYTGPADERIDFLEMCRQSMCALLGCMNNFLIDENVGLSLNDFGFTKF